MKIMKRTQNPLNSPKSFKIMYFFSVIFCGKSLEGADGFLQAKLASTLLKWFSFLQFRNPYGQSVQSKLFSQYLWLRLEPYLQARAPLWGNQVALLTKKYLATMDCLGKVLYLISSTTSDEDKKFMTFTTGLSQRFFKKLLFPKSVWPLFVYKTIEFQLDSRLSLQEHLCWQ